MPDNLELRNLLAHLSPERRPRRERPELEALECRALMAFDFSAGYQILGMGVTITAVGTDSKGDTYVAGSYTGDADFGKDAAGNVYQKDNPSSTDYEAFVVKYSPSGVIDWFTQFEPQSSISDSYSTAHSLVVDQSNQTVYVVGNFYGEVDFDPFGAGDTVTSSDSGYSEDAYIIGLSESPDGTNGRENNMLFDDFVRTAAPEPYAVPDDVTVDTAGDAVYLGGSYYGGSISITDIQGNTTPLANPPTLPTYEGFVLKFNANLVLDWASNIMTDSSTVFDNSFVHGIASSAQNGIDYVVGEYGAGDSASFVEVLNDMNGEWINTDRLTTTSGQLALVSGVATDNAGNAYVVGTFAGQFTPTPTSAPLVSTGATNAFIVKFDSNLDDLFQDRFGSTNIDSGDAVGVDLTTGSAFMSGEDGGPSSFGTSQTAILRGDDASDTREAYVIEISSSGTFQAGAQAGVTGSNAFSEATTLAVNVSGQVAIGGTMAPTITLGSDTLSNATGQAFIGNLTSTPAFVGEQRVFSGRRKHKKFIGFEFKFSGALNVGSAESTGDYHIGQRNGKKLRPLRVRSASYNPGNFSVTVSVAGFKTGKSASATVAGLLGANGQAITPFTTAL